jgi:tetratricopeptide (TPR) repeat protein
MKRRTPGGWGRALVLGAALALAGCGASQSKVVDPLIAARADGPRSDDADEVGRWLLLELVAPGGQSGQAHAARKRLEEVGKTDKGLYATLGRAVDDEVHGSLAGAAASYLDVIDAARSHEGPEAELVAWFASSRLLRLRPSVAGIWSGAKARVERAIAEPGSLGFRARGDLVDWWMFDTRREGKLDAKTVEERAVGMLGCLREARLAGPFGGVAPLDVVTRFDPEKPGPWPLVFEQHPRRVEAPHIVEREQGTGCGIRGMGTPAPGVHYVETFFELEEENDVVIAVQGAWSVLVDDVEVLARDPRVFGVWPRFAVAVHLGPGRHRLVGRIGAPETSIRVLDRFGKPVALRASTDASIPYSLGRPKALPDPNPIAPFLRAAGVKETPAWPKPAEGAELDTNDPVLRYIAAELAHVDGQEDLASVLFEPLVRQGTLATGLALATQAGFVDEDPVFSPTDARDLALDLRRRAVEKDARLWLAKLWLLVDAAQKAGPQDQLPALTELAQGFPQAPAIGKALAQMYAHLGYKPEHQRTVLDLAKRFPDDTEVLRAQLSVLDEAGRHADADKTVARIASLEPASSIQIERALLRNDLPGALALLEKEAATKSGESRDSTEKRMRDLLVRAGRRKETLGELERALAADPSSVAENLRLADARLASGDHAALRKALADAILKGVESAELRDAIEVVDGMSELEAYRLDPIAAIKDFEASGGAKAKVDKKGAQVGTAARVLDYAAMNIHADGSARMLEHEILHMASREAIAEHAEQKLPRGKLLRIRTIKADGRTLEPEIVQGKPTVTMPHLELGDYIETETLYDLPGDGRGGKSFAGPRWFFREEKVDYHRSEFIVVSPRGRKLDIETTGAVPAPQVVEEGASIVRRWRVDKSPALPEEPFSARVDEFLPSVRVGWGVSKRETLERLRDAATSMVPPDPRLQRVAMTIATAGAPQAEQAAQLRKVSAEERARRIYRWVLDNVEPGREGDPRKIVLGKSGNRAEAFVYLCRLVGVPIRHAVVQDRLAPPAIGPFSEIDQLSQLALVMPNKQGDVWMTVGDKYAPFGYMPSSLRGQEATMLDAALTKVTTSTGGPPDGVVHEGDAELHADGSATIRLEQRYTGRLAIELRNGVQSLPEDRLKDIVEAKLVGQAVPGGRLRSMEIEGLTDLDEPLVLKLVIEASTFAKRAGNGLVFSPPLQVTLSPLAALERRETPLVITHGLAIRVGVKLRVKLPAGAKATPPGTAKGEHGGRSFVANDRVEDGVLVLDRVVDVPAGRVAPEDYPAFAAFVRATEEALHRDWVIELP